MFNHYHKTKNIKYIMGCIIMNRTLQERVAWIMNRKTSNDCLEKKKSKKIEKQ